jgi:hypothetical protein
MSITDTIAVRCERISPHEISEASWNAHSGGRDVVRGEARYGVADGDADPCD